MPDYNNDDRGLLFAEENKTNPKAPDWTGFATITEQLAGKTVELAGWDGRTDSDKKKISLKFSLPRNGANPEHDCSENAGLLFTAQTKVNPKAPDYRGAAHIAPTLCGKRVRVAAWHNREDGSFRLVVEEMRVRQAA